MEIIQNNYNNLLYQIQELVGNTEQNLTKIVNRQKLEMSWKIGKMVDQYLLKENGIEYGEKLFEKLESDIFIKKRTLYEMRSFYKAYPVLPKEETGLNWSHYKNLSAISDLRQRKYLEDFTIKNSLSVSQLREEIAKNPVKKAKSKSVSKITEVMPLKATRGNLFTYKIRSFPHSNQKMIDCGFNIFRNIETDLEDGVVVTSKKNKDDYSLTKYSKESSKLYTYKAYLERVVDGDTLRVVLDLGFETHHREILRLSGINAPEKKTTAGQKSSLALQKMLKDVPFLVIKTNKVDIFGRYIADVFFSKDGEEDVQKVADEGIYLSQMILNAGLAEKY